MHRRNFLKVLGLAAVAGTAQLSLASLASAAASRSVAFGGRLYRWDGTGRIGVSADNGATWSLHSDLGPSNSVTKLAVDRANRLTASVTYAGLGFRLVLGPNQASWKTA